MTKRNLLLVGLFVLFGIVAYAATLTSPLSVSQFGGHSEPDTGTIVKSPSEPPAATYMLFSYINTFMAGGTAAFANFGTGILFANTTMDPFGLDPATAKGSAVPQSGSCTVYLYPADPNVGVQTFTTPTIPSGGSWAFDVASSVPGFAGNTGYAIAICNFQNAYGTVWIYDNYGIGAPTTLAPYEAYILPDPHLYPRTTAGHSVGESAIAPVDIIKLLQKLINDPSKK
jgi:hypothetical protein